MTTLLSDTQALRTSGALVLVGSPQGGVMNNVFDNNSEPATTTKTEREVLVSQRSSAWNAGMQLALPVVSLCLLGAAHLARHAPLELLTAAGVLMACGFCLFAVAKASLLRQERWVSFGTAHMTRRHRIGYRIGYALMIAGAVVTAGFLIAWP